MFSDCAKENRRCFALKMGKSKSVLWQYFKAKSNNNGTTSYSCMFCNKEYKKNATRMAAHLCKCSNCPNNIKKRITNKDSHKGKNLQF